MKPKGYFTNELDINLLTKALSEVLSTPTKEVTVIAVPKNKRMENTKND